jgi:hypothetical protein
MTEPLAVTDFDTFQGRRLRRQHARGARMTKPRSSPMSTLARRLGPSRLLSCHTAEMLTSVEPIAASMLVTEFSC